MKRLSPAGIFFYSLANFGFGCFYAFNNFALGLWLKNYTENAILLGLAAGTHGFEGAIIQPIVGAWSDKLRTRLGRRRPFLLAFIPLTALFLILTPLAAHLPGSLKLTAVFACVLLFTVLFNIAADPYQSLMADITPRAQQGRVAGVWFFVGALGQIVILLAKLPITVKFGLVAGVMLLTTLLTCATTSEPTPPPHSAQTARRRDDLREALRGLGTLRQTRIYMAMFFAYGAGVECVVPYLSLFIQKITRCDDAVAQRMIIVLFIVTAIGSPIFGWMNDKIGSKRLMMASLVLVAAAAINGLWVTTLTQIAVVLGLAGLGIAAQNASAYPLLLQLIPEQEVGFYTGLRTTAVSVAGPGALALTGFLINHSSYRVIFAVCAVCIIIGLLVLTRLRVADAAGEIAARDLAQGRGPLDANLPRPA